MKNILICRKVKQNKTKNPKQTFFENSVQASSLYQEDAQKNTLIKFGMWFHKVHSILQPTHDLYNL